MGKEIIKRLDKLERSNRVLIAYVEDLRELVGEAIGKQAFTVQELIKHWDAGITSQ